MTRLAVDLRNVSKRYLQFTPNLGLKAYLVGLQSPDSAPEPKWALSNIDLQVERGEFVGLIGENGAGKSTMLGLIAGVIKPTCGEVIVQGRIAPLLELGAGFDHELTGRENILVNGILLGLTRRQVMERIDEIIAFTELGDMIDEPMRVYSSGMYVRLGFSVAVHTYPDILLVDEVIGVGDARFQKKCISKMKEFRRLGTTLILVTHRMQEASEICDRIVYLNKGQIVMSGDPGEVVRRYEEACNE